MKKYPCIESTIDLPYKDKLIRLWIDEYSVEDSYPLNKVFANSIIEYLKDEPSNSDLVDFIHKNIAHVNAVQIKDRTENDVSHGVAAYLVDFNTDIHG